MFFPQRFLSSLTISLDIHTLPLTGSDTETHKDTHTHTHTQTDMYRHTYALTPLADGRGNPSSGAVGYWCLLWCWLAAALLPWQLPTDSLAWWLVLSSREVAGLLFKRIIINNREEPGRHLKSLTCCLDTLMSDLFFKMYLFFYLFSWKICKTDLQQITNGSLLWLAHSQKNSCH